MPDITTDSKGGDAQSRIPSVWRRIGWFILLYVASFGAFSIVAYALRWLIVVD